MTTLHLRKSIDRSLLRRGLLLIPLLFVCFGLAPTARAVSPAPDGGYAGNNTAEGTNALFSLTTGVKNTAIGFHALNSNTTGNHNTATGFLALHVNNGNGNTADGFEALLNNTTGHDNTATGWEALLHNTADFNTANGSRALSNNTTGFENTAIGNEALLVNTVGQDNTAIGFQALRNNGGSIGEAGDANTASGSLALFSNTTGGNNTANGFRALLANTIGNDNTAIGLDALLFNNGGSFNTATGAHALGNNTIGNDNTAIGLDALLFNTADNNTATGAGALDSNTIGGSNTANGFNALFSNTIGSGNIALGSSAGDNLDTGDSNIDIGNEGFAGEANTIRIGDPAAQNATFIAGIRDTTTGNDDAIPVVIDSAGQLGTASSSARFKREIKPMDRASEAILTLKPVTFHYKSHKSSATGRPQFGLIAEEVAKVNPDLVVRDAKGEIYTVRYDAVNAMLLNEFLKEHRTVRELRSAVAKQDATIAALTAGLKEQAAQIQKVSDKVELSKPAPQTVLNDQ